MTDSNDINKAPVQSTVAKGMGFSKLPTFSSINEMAKKKMHIVAPLGFALFIGGAFYLDNSYSGKKSQILNNNVVAKECALSGYTAEGCEQFKPQEVTSTTPKQPTTEAKPSKLEETITSDKILAQGQIGPIELRFRNYGGPLNASEPTIEYSTDKWKTQNEIGMNYQLKAALDRAYSETKDCGLFPTKSEFNDFNILVTKGIEAGLTVKIEDYRTKFEVPYGKRCYTTEPTIKTGE